MNNTTTTSSSTMVMYDRYVNRRGYVIRKASLSEDQIQHIRADLTVSPIQPTSLSIQLPVVKFKLFKENDTKLYVPRHYGEQTFGPPEYNELVTSTVYQPIQVMFVQQLREEQHVAVEKYMEQANAIGGGLLQLPCGFGKTVVALYLVSVIQLKTIIIVHKEFLLNKWIERITMYLPTAKIGTLQGKIIDVEGKDIVIAMLQSISTKEYSPEVISPFGFAIVDECHHMGAEVFSKALPKIFTKYMLGLSATPNRKDGLRNVFEWYLGPPAYTIVRKINQQVMLRKYDFVDPQASQQLKKYKENNPASRIKLVTHLVTSPERNQLLISIIQELLSLEDGPERHILLLSDRRKHLEDLSVTLQSLGIEYGFYWGGEKQSKLDDAQQRKVILGTYNMASEAMDIPSLNTMILATPKSDIEQSVGRILRKVHDITPILVDIFDGDYECFKRQYYIRNRYYRKSGIGQICLLPEEDDTENSMSTMEYEFVFEEEGEENPSR